MNNESFTGAGSKEKPISDSMQASDQKAKLEEMLRGKKAIPFIELSGEVKKQLEDILERLKRIKETIQKNSSSINNKNNNIKEIVEKLKVVPSIEINKEVFKDFDKNFVNYSSVAQFYIQELAFYISYYSKYLADDHPKEMLVDKNSSDLFFDHISIIIRRLKNLAKKRSKDIMILFSRYDHGFNTQLRQLNIVESYLKANPKKEGGKVGGV